MGSWGINAFQSDIGLDAIGDIRNNLLTNGELKLGDAIALLQQDEWYAPSSKDGRSHTGMEALAELIVKFINHDLNDIDLTEDSQKFSELSSFIAEKNDIKELRDYLADTLHSAVETEKENSENGDPNFDAIFGGWYDQEDWIEWQDHMSKLIQHLDTLLSYEGNDVLNLATLDLPKPSDNQENEQTDVPLIL